MAIVMRDQSGLDARSNRTPHGAKPKTRSLNRWAVLVLTALAGITASSIAAEATCTVYQHRDYKGSHWTLRGREALQVAGEPCGATGGDYRIYYQPSWNDQVSSFRVTNGCTITLWEHARGCGGGGHHFRSNRSYTYVGDAWNDKTSFVDCVCR
jgi:peptidase inhibitor family I36